MDRNNNHEHGSGGCGCDGHGEGQGGDAQHHYHPDHNHGHHRHEHGQHGHGQPGQGPKYCLNIEGREIDWHEPTITAAKVAELGGWPLNQGVLEVMEDNSERTVGPEEVIHLQPGRGFCRRIRWKRGLTRVDRIDAEIGLLRKHFPNLRREGDWLLLPAVELSAGWLPSVTDVAFQINVDFPANPPYGIYVRGGLRHNGQKPNNYTEPAATKPPFGGDWAVFSWSVNEQAEWHAAARPEDGANLLQWARSFRQRFEEGV